MYRTRRLLRVLPVLLAVAACAMQASMAPVSSETPTKPSADAQSQPSLRAISFADRKHGWVGGDNLILGTADAGTSWAKQYGGDDSIYELHALDAQTAWAVGERVLLHTTDGGEVWKQVSRIGRPLRSVHFVSSSIGYALAGSDSHATLLTTADAGQHWLPVDMPSGASGVLAATFVAPATGWIVDDSFRVLHTTDSGKTWRSQWQAPVAGDPTWGETGDAKLWFGPQGTGWVLLDAGQGCMSQMAYVLASTGDAGSHWSIRQATAGCHLNRVLPTPSFSVAGYPVALAQQSSSRALFVVNSVALPSLTVVATSDNGASWTERGHIGGAFSRVAVDVVDQNSGWILATPLGEHLASRLFRTDDAGTHWAPRKAG